MEIKVLDILLSIIENVIIILFANSLMKKRYTQPIVYLLVVLACSCVPFFFSDINIYLKSLLSIVQLIASFSILYSDRLYVKIGFVATCLYLFYIIDIVVGNIFTVLLGQRLYSVFFDSFTNRFIVCLLIKVLNAFMFIWIKKMFSKINLNIITKKWILFDVIVSVFLIISVSFLNMYSFVEPDFATSVLFTTISFAFLIMSIIVIYFFTEICSSFQHEKKIYEMQTSFESMQSIITIQYQTNARLQKIRHDMKKHLINVAQLWNNNNSTEAYRLLLQTVDFVSDVGLQLKSSTGNSFIDAKISSVATKCQNSRINFIYELEVLPEVIIPLIDLSALLSNLFDNAVESAEKSKEPEIKTKIFAYKGYIYINISNSFIGKLNSKNGILISTKLRKHAHGYGTQIINDICERYNGAYVWKTENNIFIANIILKNE